MEEPAWPLQSNYLHLNIFIVNIYVEPEICLTKNQKPRKEIVGCLPTDTKADYSPITHLLLPVPPGWSHPGESEAVPLFLLSTSPEQ